MLKISSIEFAEPRKGGAGVGDNSRAGCKRSKFNGSRIDDVEVDGSEVGNNEVEKKS